jgi:hypothetical protein
LPQLSRLTAAKELQRRRSIRRSLTEWCRSAGFEPAAHHRLLLDKLEEVSSGKIDRLAVFMPPGAAKSTYASILYTPWHLAQNPKANVIAASHTAELAEKFGRRVRNLIVEHSPVLGVGLAPDSQAAGRWETDHGGEYFAAGVGGAIAGRRADLVVIDDPIRSREDADSETVRDKIWDWYKSDLYTRLKPGGRIVLIQTRWHEDDLAGRLLADMAAGGDHWEVISLPALAEADDPLGRTVGQPLWPEWEDEANLERKRRAVGARDWSALYQQRPAPEDGDYFKLEWLKHYDIAPDSIRCGSMADLITLSPLTEAISRSMPLSASILKTGCSCSTSGASRRRPMSGLRRFAIWLSSGSRSAGQRSRANPLWHRPVS